MNMRLLLYVLLISGFTYGIRSVKIKKIPKSEKNAGFWKQDSIRELKRVFNTKVNEKYARNVVLFIGDGMGISTVTAARVHKNQRDFMSKQPDKKLRFEEFPNVALVDTSTVDRYVSDSAATATAILSGVKTNIELIGVGPNAKNLDCKNYNPALHDLVTIGDMFHAQGRSVGLVSSARITHATPASLYAHSVSRHWEYYVPKKCPRSIKDISRQFIDKSDRFQIVLGGGRKNFLPKNNGGNRKDNLNLTAEWLLKLRGKRTKYLTTAQELKALNYSKYDHVLGIFNDGTMNYDHQRTPEEPDLTEMTVAAIKMLQKNKKGFFLLVEGARIDNAHHKGQAQIALKETLKLEEAVSEALKMLNMDDTLVMVTADHSHVFTIGNYVHRENDITQINNLFKGKDKKSFTSLAYSNGPGYIVPRPNLSVNSRLPLKHIYSSGIPFKKETHGGEDVAVYAQGPWSHLLRGQKRQNYLGHVMMFASCTIDRKSAEMDNRMLKHCSSNSQSIVQFNFVIWIGNLLVVIMKLM